MKVTGFAKSVVGSRDSNQDSFLVWNERSLFAVADGVGGGLKGEVASKMAAEGMRELPEGTTALRPLVETLQARVLKESMDTIGEALMGTTLTTLLVADGKAYITHVGDSRCYLFASEAIAQLTVDHEIFDESMGGPVLASYLGIPTDIHPITIQEEVVSVVPGNRFILCSDGLYKQVEESRIAQLIRDRDDDPEALLDQLCSEAATDPYSDNVTIVYVQIDED